SVPSQVVAIDNASAGALKFGGTLDNAGSLYALNTTRTATAIINAGSIFNETSGLISTLVPTSIASLVSGAHTTSLALSALQGITNDGRISSGANLKLTSPTITNSGSISAVGNATLAALTNQLTIDNTGGSIDAGRTLTVQTGPTTKDSAGNVISRAN